MSVTRSATAARSCRAGVGRRSTELVADHAAAQLGCGREVLRTMGISGESSITAAKSGSSRDPARVRQTKEAFTPTRDVLRAPAQLGRRPGRARRRQRAIAPSVKWHSARRFARNNSRSGTRRRGEAPRQERPRPDPAGLGKPRRCRPGHPLRQVRMRCSSRRAARRCSNWTPLATAARRRGVVGRGSGALTAEVSAEVSGRGAQQRRLTPSSGVLRGQRLRATDARSRPVVSGLAWPISSRSTSRSIPAAASSVP